MAALNLSDEALRDLVQGPGDVEWRQVTSCQATSSAGWLLLLPRLTMV